MGSYSMRRSLIKIIVEAVNMIYWKPKKLEAERPAGRVLK
jgi:hypothetical protein